MSLGVLEAPDSASRSIPVVGMIAMPEAITAIHTGRMRATVSFDAPALVCTALMATLRILEMPKVIALPAEFIGRENCAEWDCPYEECPLPEWGGWSGKLNGIFL
ncbi:MAG: hypothetical protein ABJO66_05505 [Parvibaculum sp.]|uniref:hypothetical protein n=1 Tax=Alphaproteobacteria TaxID=28211 RepID=UPI003297268D